MSCCGDEVPVQYRYTGDGVLQRSEDGGTTWTDAPEFDPRNNSPQFPPISGADGDDKKCIAATGAAALIKEQVSDQLTDDMSRYTLAQLITDWTQTYIRTSNPFEALLTVVANQIFALVIATLRPALTDPVFVTLKCIFYCNVANDATVNDAQWSKIRSDITAQIGGIAGIFLEHLVYLLGTAGTSNILRAGAATSGDCSDCDCDENCDVENYVKWTKFTGLGSVVGYGDDYVEVESSLTSDFGAQAVGIVTTGDCCWWAGAEFVVEPNGGMNTYAYYCGSNLAGSPDESHTNFPTNSASYQAIILYAGSSVFRVKIFLNKTGP